MRRYSLSIEYIRERIDSFSARLTPRFAVFIPKELYAIASCLRMPYKRSPDDEAKLLQADCSQ
ncbi:hypothetical protein [Coleofasciculus sp. FACHB-T130]|uniref:hypothetical protein n=1 Tax=Coleofasciculus sp. FACHB-T130 TaxID=2692792 RepID=UPI00168214E9|nr:hypothetical protein [Coleofasciculus sp. FACHB-T130]